MKVYYFLRELLSKLPVTNFFNFDYNYLKNKLTDSLCNYLQNIKTKTLPFVYDCPSDLIVDDLNKKLMYSIAVNFVLINLFTICMCIKINEVKSIRYNLKTLDEMLTNIKTSVSQKKLKRNKDHNKYVKKQKLSDLKPINLDLNNKFLETFIFEPFTTNEEDINIIKKWNDELEKEIKLDNKLKQSTNVSFVEIDLNSEEECEYEKVN